MNNNTKPVESISDLKRRRLRLVEEIASAHAANIPCVEKTQELLRIDMQILNLEDNLRRNPGQ